MKQEIPYLCQKCSYDLTGLEALGKCPECGNAYNIRSLVGVKFDARPKTLGQQLLWHLRSLILAILAVLVLLIGLVVSLSLALFTSSSNMGGSSSVVSYPLQPLAIGGLIAAVLALAAVTSYMYERN